MTANLESGKIYSVQYLRAIAALCVVAFHASFYIHLYRQDSSFFATFGLSPYGGLLLGRSGVALFFVISGYLMAKIAPKALGATFLAHRVARIYPIYWIMVSVVVSLRVLAGQEFRINPYSLGLVPGGPREYSLGVEWTLPFEVLFYVIIFFIITIRARKYLHLLAFAWMIAIVGTRILQPQTNVQYPSLLSLPIAEMSFPFAAGLMIPFVLRWRWPREAGYILGIGLIAYGVFSPLLAIWVTSLGSALIVAAAVAPQSASFRKSTPQEPRSAQTGHARTFIFKDRRASIALLGDWSFALYLVHVPIIQLLYGRLSGRLSAPGLWFSAVGASLLAATIIGRLDIGIYAALKRQIDRTRPRVLLAANAVFLVAFLGAATNVELDNCGCVFVAQNADRMGQDLQALGVQHEIEIAPYASARSMQKSTSIVFVFDAVERNEAGQLRVAGWAFDVADPGRNLMVLAFYGGKYLGHVRAQDLRRDVTDAFHLREGTRLGFDGVLPLSECKASSNLLLVVALTNRTGYAVHELPSGPIGCPSERPSAAGL